MGSLGLLLRQKYTGVGLTLQQAKSAGAEVIVEAIKSGGSAQASRKIQIGDSILAVNGHPIRDVTDCKKQILGEPGSLVELQCKSSANGSFYSVALEREKLDDRDASQVVVERVVPGGPAALDGTISPGDVILEIDGQRVQDLSTARSRFSGAYGAAAEIVCRRGTETFRVQLTRDSPMYPQEEEGDLNIFSSVGKALENLAHPIASLCSPSRVNDYQEHKPRPQSEDIRLNSLLQENEQLMKDIEASRQELDMLTRKKQELALRNSQIAHDRASQAEFHKIAQPPPVNPPKIEESQQVPNSHDKKPHPEVPKITEPPSNVPSQPEPTIHREVKPPEIKTEDQTGISNEQKAESKRNDSRPSPRTPDDKARLITPNYLLRKLDPAVDDMGWILLTLKGIRRADKLGELSLHIDNEVIFQRKLEATDESFNHSYQIAVSKAEQQKGHVIVAKYVKPTSQEAQKNASAKPDGTGIGQVTFPIHLLAKEPFPDMQGWFEFKPLPNTIVFMHVRFQLNKRDK